MAEPSDLAAARRHLARAEAAYMTAEGLVQLEEGLALLEAVIAAGGQSERVAHNLANAYQTKIYGRVKQRFEADPALPETECEHLFKLLIAFDESRIPLPEDARAIKVGVVRRLIELYYEGHSPAEKEKAIEQLLEIAGRTR